MKRFAIYDTRHTQRLGEIKALNAADALREARSQWPHVPARYLREAEIPKGAAQ